MFAKYRSVSLILRIIIGLVIGAALAVIFLKPHLLGSWANCLSAR